jgi:DNA-binding NarL/FixJ family response regulator
VIDAPELAYSLGASGFLPKPVRRDEILAALHDLQLV